MRNCLQTDNKDITWRNTDNVSLSRIREFFDSVAEYEFGMYCHKNFLILV